MKFCKVGERKRFCMDGETNDRIQSIKIPVKWSDWSIGELWLCPRHSTYIMVTPMFILGRTNQTHKQYLYSLNVKPNHESVNDCRSFGILVSQISSVCVFLDIPILLKEKCHKKWTTLPGCYLAMCTPFSILSDRFEEVRDKKVRNNGWVINGCIDFGSIMLNESWQCSNSRGER